MCNILYYVHMYKYIYVLRYVKYMSTYVYKYMCNHIYTYIKYILVACKEKHVLLEVEGP